MPLRLERANRSDVPELAAVYFSTFKSPLVLRLKPNVPSVREWYGAQLEASFDKQHCHVYKVVEYGDDNDGGGTQSTDLLQRPEIIAFATWQSPQLKTAQVQDTRGPEWPAAGDPALFEEVVLKATRIRDDLVGDREHWYLGVLATLPQHQRRGAGSLLMGELCRQADEAGQPAYLEASPSGKSTYERFGFEAKSSFTTVINGEDYVDACMVREPKSKDGAGAQ
ncbi:acyl-CoA N-acyltransferase [Microdochium trichocladiopsis]|uniref:Acyl-CoA N-acyltransferase n=1 Tax=Microdochium trichocladiopsis TaxID=1682393 RepID=A0A9P9BLK2_9PEZI|nr:acyl-CoA N-acyltransferase [Microdochium trichocladiopsis]KAH7014177.1 acyl-CoA N-acyltransferase [Microdochium trichocladiopsis]